MLKIKWNFAKGTKFAW